MIVSYVIRWEAFLIVCVCAPYIIVRHKNGFK